MDELRRDFGKHVAGSFQASLGWKAFTNLLQVLAWAGAAQKAYEAYDTWDDPEGDRVVKMLDMANGGVATVQLVAGISETMLQMFGKMPQLAKTILEKTGNVCGYVGAIMGMIQGAYEMYQGMASIYHGGTKTLGWRGPAPGS